MTILTEVLRSTVILSLITAILLSIFLPMAEATKLEPDVYDLWNTLEEFENTSRLQEYLIEKDWVSHTVSIQDLDYIVTLVHQLSSTYFPDVPPALILAMMSIESSFRSDLVGFNNDTGLLQVIPKWHTERIEKYIYEENVDLTDPRLNIMVATDYMDELIKDCDGCLPEALMCYNEGPAKAKKRYSRGTVSAYAYDILTRYIAIDRVIKQVAYSERMNR